MQIAGQGAPAGIGQPVGVGDQGGVGQGGIAHPDPQQALALDHDASVPESGEGEAASAVAAFLKASEARNARQLSIVRTNALGTPYFEADLMELARPGLTMINLPKPESAADVLAAVAILEIAEAANDIGRPIALLANIETTGALRRAVAIATAHTRLVGFPLGLGDLFEPLAMRRRDVANVHDAMAAVRTQARDTGRWPGRADSGWWLVGGLRG